MTASATVLPFTTADYPEWHKGRQRYGVWYIPIDDAVVADYCCQLRGELHELLADDYRRQWHITLFVNGFYVDVRSLPLEVQQLAYAKGLIPFVPST